MTKIPIDEIIKKSELHRQSNYVGRPKGTTDLTQAIRKEIHDRLEKLLDELDDMDASFESGYYSAIKEMQELIGYTE